MTNSEAYRHKSTTDEIAARFDKDVERFSNLETGQTATVDAVHAMELITRAAVAVTRPINNVLDIGCGAGNMTLKLLSLIGDANCDLVDLSAPMLARAKQRINSVNSRRTREFRGDFRILSLEENHYDVIIAAAVLHHLRDDADWQTCFEKLFRLLSPGGSVWITDLVSHENGAVQQMMWDGYGDYLVQSGTALYGDGEVYRDKVFAYIEKEDSPRPVSYQLALLRQVGFDHVDLLHKNSCFAAFGAVKARH